MLVVDRDAVRRCREFSSDSRLLDEVIDVSIGGVFPDFFNLVVGEGLVLNIGARGSAVWNYMKRNGYSLVAERFFECDLSYDLVKASSGIGIVADEVALPFANAKFTCVFGIMVMHVVNDLISVLCQVYSVLVASGIFIATFFGSKTLLELRKVMMLAEAELNAGVSARFINFWNVDRLVNNYRNAGIYNLVIDINNITFKCTSLLDAFSFLRTTGEGSVLKHPRKPLNKAVMKKAQEIYSSTCDSINFEIITIKASK